MNSEGTRVEPLRLWPGIALLIVLVLTRFGIPVVAPEVGPMAWFAGVLGGLLIGVWWVFFSRATGTERWGAAALVIAALAATPLVLHESVAKAGMGVLFLFYAIPGVSAAFVLWAALTRGWGAKARGVSMVVAVVLSCAAWGLVRTSGLTGSSGAHFSWRWTPSPEELLLAAEEDALAPVPVEVDGAGSAPEWPGFRGPGRDSILSAARLETDWTGSPPVELWRRAIGPGWSSFAVHGERFYTQEQRGEDELVSCYAAASGEPIWRHADPVRFWESNAGAGPRATPTLADGRVYTLGATGTLNALEAQTGAVVWSRNIAADTGAEVPEWGFSSSPLVLDGQVVVAAAGQFVSYDLASGEPAWSGPAGEGYSSPHPVVLDGVQQLLLLSGEGLTSVAPTDGAQLWRHDWAGPPIVQPALMPNGDLLISTGGASGAVGGRRIAVTRGSDGWSVEERWTSNRLKPYFSDFVIHGGHAYGFDGSILTCIDLEDGQRKWKGGRYGHGQLVLLREQELLLLISEQGELALVEATPEGHTELARFPALEGKTWNHPVLVGDLLLTRNGQEMAAFRLPLQ